MLERIRQRLDVPVTMIAHSMRHAHRKLIGLASQNAQSYLRVRVKAKVKCRRLASFLGRVVSWDAIDADPYYHFIYLSNFTVSCIASRPCR